MYFSDILEPALTPDDADDTPIFPPVPESDTVKSPAATVSQQPRHAPAQAAQSSSKASEYLLVCL